MAEELDNRRIDQLPPSAGATPGSKLAMWNNALSKTESIDIALFLNPTDTQNFEWISDEDYLEDEVVTYGGFWYQALSDNTGVTPGTDDAIWLPITKSPTGLVPWSAGVFTDDYVFVMYDLNQDDSDPDWGLYALKNPPARPYVSADFEVELAAGDWVIVAGGGPDHFKGLYASSAALSAAWPTALPGDYAYVDAGAASDVELWSWDDSDSTWKKIGTTSITAWSTTTPGTVERSTTGEAQNIVTRTAAGSSNSSNDDGRTPSEKGLVEMLLSFLATAWTWTLTQTFTAGSIHSNVTASLMAAFDGSKRLVSIAYAALADFITGTDSVKPVTVAAFLSFRRIRPTAVSVVAGTPNLLTCDAAGAVECGFIVGTTQTANFTVNFSNHADAQYIEVWFPINGNVVVTFTNGTSGQPNVVSEDADLRYASKALSLSASSAKWFRCGFTRLTSGATGVISMEVSTPIATS